MTIIQNMEASWPKVSFRNISRFIGSITSMIPVLGPVAQRKLRYLQGIINYRNLNGVPWDNFPHFNKIKFEYNAFNELIFFKNNSVHSNKCAGCVHINLFANKFA